MAHCARVALSTLRSAMSASASSFYRGQSLQEHKAACTKYDFGLPAKLVTADDRILQCCLYVHGLVKAAAAAGPANLVLLTNDNALAVKAKVRPGGCCRCRRVAAAAAGWLLLPARRMLVQPCKRGLC